MTDPTPDATSAFERACAALAASAGYDWAVMVEEYPTQAEGLRRGFAAGLRELRGGGEAPLRASEAALSDTRNDPKGKWRNLDLSEVAIRAWVDAILKDAPDDR